jgi:hypothetical protein
MPIFDEPEGDDEHSADAPIRVCPHCATQSRTAGDFCPHCGKSFLKRSRRMSRRAKVVLAATLALLLLGGGGTAVALKIQSDNEAQERRERAARIAKEQREREERERRAEEKREREEREAQEALDEIELEGRTALEKDLRKAITKHARGLVSDGLLDGPILKSVCDPVGGGRDDLEAKTGKYECMAVSEENADGTMRGYSYDATINYDKFTYSWKLGDS